jgi:hypothetical protein
MRSHGRSASSDTMKGIEKDDGNEVDILNLVPHNRVGFQNQIFIRENNTDISSLMAS